MFNEYLIEDAAEYGIETAQEAVPYILEILGSGGQWSAHELVHADPDGVGPTHILMAIEALVQTGTIVGPSPYDTEPTGDLTELVYWLPRWSDGSRSEQWYVRMDATISQKWDDRNKLYPFRF